MSAPNYWDYLQVDRLLELQGGLEGDDAQISSDELHFIVVHQVYELWLKLLLRELRDARDQLAVERVDEQIIPRVVHHLTRVEEILRLMTAQWAVMETLTPQDFLVFRDKLAPASGFQSFQMRELELVLGLGTDQRLKYGGVDPIDHIREVSQKARGGDKVRKQINAALEELSLRDALQRWLQRTPIQGSCLGEADDAGTVDKFLTEYLQAWESAQRKVAGNLASAGIADPQGLKKRVESAGAGARAFLLAEDQEGEQRDATRRARAGLLFIESYRELPLLAWPRLLIDRVVAVEKQMLLWRNAHARMVERTIGRRIGTGGSSGVDYLDEAARVRIFTDLWTVRGILLAPEHLPRLQCPEFYGFAT
ncbi:tryptophan 2,3-dioxygenase [bacterium]|nr:MAG: tryptophan 2,3-dioxygenase [bacterium]